jgi:predicted DNA-binding transcriptional regulator YafY
MRADRLVATLLVLQARGRITAAELAEELEVSVKTARRDLESLAIAGIPVYSQPGKGGGWSLLGGARTDLSGLTAPEARTLFMIAGPSSTATPEAKAALRKLVQALPETFRADAEAAASAIVLDPAGWGGTVVPRPEHLDVLQQAVVEGKQVRLAYADRQRSETERTVHPLGLVQKGVAWYLVADTDAGLRTFRVNRVRGVTVTDDPVERPPGFDLAGEWQAVVETIEAKRTMARAVVRAPVWAVGGLRAQFGAAVEVRRHLDDGRVEVELGAPTRHSFAEQLAGWGDHVEVIEPQEVRHRLAEIGEALVARYRASAAQPAGGPRTAIEMSR